MTPRIRQLRQLIQELNDAGVRRTTHFGLVAESLEQTRGEPRPIRRAKAFAHLLDRVEQVVLPHELITGSALGMWPLAEGLPTFGQCRKEAAALIERFVEGKRKKGQGAKGQRWGSLMLRDHYDANIAFSDLQRLIAEMSERYAGDTVTHREIGVLLENHFQFDYRRERDVMCDLPWFVANHVDLNYGKATRRGLGSIRDEIVARLDAAKAGAKRIFYESAKITIDATIRFVKRYANTVEAMREWPDVDKVRAAELANMATVLRKIAAEPPETFREAIQLVWMLHAIISIGGGSAMSFARFDQYMQPFYSRDIERGTITREEAKNLVSCLWLKVNEPHMRTVQSMAIAGVRPDGSYGATDLTRLCLEVCREVAQPYPNLAVRVCAETPEWLWGEIAATIKSGAGHPMILNDDTWVANFHRLGYPIEAARDYYNMGCVEMMIMGQTAEWRGAGQTDLPGMLELVFRNGEANLAGDAGAKTGALDSFHTFDQFLAAYIEQVRHRVRENRKGVEQQDARRCGKAYDPFGSLFIDDCLERGLDMYQGGARFGPIRPMIGKGLATVADSLAAVKTLVFDEQRITLAEMWRILEANFEGYDDLRVAMDRGTPCFGNGAPEADRIARKVFAAYTDAVHACNDGSVPGTFVTGMFSYTGHISAGEVTAATPNGRRRGETVSNGIAPSQGKDANGPTRAILSVASLDHSRITGACAYNLKLSPALLRGAAGAENLKALIKTYVEEGGCQMQVNFVDQDTLRDAQQRPELHRNLIVRVAGYSEYFNNLDQRLQNEIIARTAHAV